MTNFDAIRYDFLNHIHRGQVSNELGRTFDWTQGDCLLLAVSLLRLGAAIGGPLGNGSIGVVCGNDIAQHFTFAFPKDGKQYTLCGYGLLNDGELIEQVKLDMHSRSTTLTIDSASIDNALYLAHLSGIDAPTKEDVLRVQAHLQSCIQSSATYDVIPCLRTSTYQADLDTRGYELKVTHEVHNDSRLCGIIQQRGLFHSAWELELNEHSPSETVVTGLGR